MAGAEIVVVADEDGVEGAGDEDSRRMYEELVRVLGIERNSYHSCSMDKEWSRYQLVLTKCRISRFRNTTLGAAGSCG